MTHSVLGRAHYKVLMTVRVGRTLDNPKLNTYQPRLINCLGLWPKQLSDSIVLCLWG